LRSDGEQLEKSHLSGKELPDSLNPTPGRTEKTRKGKHEKSTKKYKERKPSRNFRNVGTGFAVPKMFGGEWCMQGQHFYLYFLFLRALLERKKESNPFSPL
jgi:hypothetical protein